MSSEDEQLYGLAGNEAAQGYEPMVVQTPVPSDDDLPSADSMMSEDELRHFQRPEPPPPEEREYYGPDGKPTAPNKTISAEQGAFDVANARKAERQALEDQRNRDLADALDQPNAKDQGQQPEAGQPQPVDEPQELDPDAAYAQAQATIAEGDAEVAKFLENPFVRERVEREFSAVTQQAAAQVEQAKQQAAATINNLAQEVNVIGAALFPEFVGMSEEQARGALALMAKTNPQRVREIADFANRTQGIMNAAQQQQFQQQQVAQQQIEMQQKQAAENFRRYAEQQDAAALPNETPETISAIRKTLIEDAQQAGITKEQLYEAYNRSPELRHSFVQNLLSDGVKFRMAQRAVVQARHNPVQKVQRPGVASPGPTADPGEIAAAMSRFNLPGGNEGPQGIKNAAAWLTARRARG